MKTKKNLFILIASLSFGLSSSIFADIDESEYRLCTRHIYNHSNTPWEINFSNKVPYGAHVDVNGSNTVCTHNEHPCTIPPKSTASVQFNGTPSSMEHTGTITIEDKEHVKHSFNYNTVRVWLNKCIRIQHQGNTGSVTLNNPENGDIIIERDKW